MTNEVNYTPIKYACNGATDSFSFQWKIIAASDLIVILEDETTKEQITLNDGVDYMLYQYVVGGYIVTTSKYPQGKNIILSRDVSRYQDKTYSSSSGFQAKEIEESFDKLSANVQDLKYTLDRALKVPIGSGKLNVEFPEKLINDNTLVWSDEEDAFVNYDVIGEMDSFEQEIEADVDAFKSSVNQTLQQNKQNTDADISSFKQSVNSEISSFKQNVNTQIETFEQEVEADIDSFKNTTNQTLQQNKQNTDADISSFKQSVNSEILSFKQNVNTQIETFEQEQQTAYDEFTAGVDEKIEKVADAAGKIDELEESVSVAVKAAEDATNAAEQLTGALDSFVTKEELDEAVENVDVDLTDYIKNKEVMTDSIVIGNNTSTGGNAVSIGTGQKVTGRYGIALGADSTLSNTSGISIGKSNTLSGSSNIAIGSSLTTRDGNSIAIGMGSYPNPSASGGNSIAIGTIAQATGSESVALGRAAKATQSYAIQLGIGTNNTADTLQVWDYPLLNKADGKIYADRLPESGGLPIGMVVPVTASAGHAPENTLYCDGSEFSGAEGQMFSSLYNDYLVGKVQLISGIFDVYYNSSSNYETLLALKLSDDVTTQKTILIDESLAKNSYIVYLKDGYLLVGDRVNSSGFQQTAVEPNSVVYIKLKFENGSLVVSSGTSKSNLSEPFVFDSVSVIGSHFTITSKLICDVLSSSVINGKAFYANDAFCAGVIYYSAPTITDGGDSIEGARLETCTYDEYQTELTMTGSCYKWAVDIENKKFRIPFVPDKVLVDIADTVGVKGNGNAVGLQSNNGVENTYMGIHNISNNGVRHFLISGISSSPKAGSSLTYTTALGDNDTTLGIATDASKSGIIADTTNAKTYKKIRHYVVVATGSINQNEADWSEFASSLASKANKTDVDGQWVAKQAVLTQAVTKGETVMDLSEYLPNDGYQYEVLLLASWGDDGSNDYYIYSDIIPKSSLALYSSTYGYFNGSYITMPVGTGRVLYQYLSNAAVSDATRGIEALAYRRIGTNQ